MTLVFQPGNSSGIKPLFCFASSSVVVSPEPCFSLSVEIGLASHWKTKVAAAAAPSKGMHSPPASSSVLCAHM
uniref:Uncharacterized protein n=1 Tax=Knipowitschia caucasica TaxID=637954 RepID=A0AAV2LCC7_KNICA